jgi:hypothetical protein
MAAASLVAVLWALGVPAADASCGRSSSSQWSPDIARAANESITGGNSACNGLVPVAVLRLPGHAVPGTCNEAVGFANAEPATEEMDITLGRLHVPSPGSQPSTGPVANVWNGATVHLPYVATATLARHHRRCKSGPKW